MNYNNSVASNQLENDGLVPELPFLTQIPKTLKAYPNWVCWEYVEVASGKLMRAPASTPAPLNETLKRCSDKPQGLGFLLTPDDPFTVVHIEKYCNQEGNIGTDVQDIIKMASTYTEKDDNLGELYILGYAEGLWNIAKDNVKIVSQNFIVPITGNSLGAFPDVQGRATEFSRIASRYCAQSWIERIEGMRAEGDEFTGLSRVLTECLDTPNWRQDADRTDLHEFLYLCWGYPRLKSRVYDQIEMDIRDFKIRSRVLDSLEDIIEQMRQERNPTKIRSSGKGDAVEEFDDDLPTIEHDEDDYAASVDATMQALIASDAQLWQRDGHIVSIRRVPVKSAGSKKKKVMSFRIVEAGKSHLLKLATSSAHHFTIKHGKNGRKSIKPSGCPTKIIEMLQEEMETDFDPLIAITTLPTLRPDGSIISKPGYDPETWLYYQPSREYPNPIENPTLDDAKHALEILKEPFIDFQFVEDCHQSAVIASILGIMARHLVGNVPLVPITANTRGTGKTLLFEVIAMIATGEEIPKSPFPNKEEEMEKQLLAHAIEGARIVCFDNLKGTIGSTALDRVLTSQYVKGRILSKSENAQVNMITNFFATGNNLRYTEDTARRSLPIAITSDMERPEERTDLTHPDLFTWVCENQPQLAMAALTILQAYILAGMPKQAIPPFGSFQDWSNLVRSAVVWVGMHDPCEGREKVENENDAEFDKLRTLIDAWSLAYGSVKRQIADVVSEVIKQYNMQQKYADPDKFGQKEGEKIEMIELGNALVAYDPKANDRISDLNPRRIAARMPVDNGRSRIIKGKCITFEMDKRTSVKSYWVETLKSDGPIAEYDDSGQTYQHDPSVDHLPF